MSQNGRILELNDLLKSFLLVDFFLQNLVKKQSEL